MAHIAPGAPKAKIAIVDDDAAMRASIVAKLRSDFEVVEGEDYVTAYRLLQEASLDVLLLALPMESGGMRECTEMLSRLACGDIDTLVIVLSTDQTKSTALKVIDAGCYDYFIQPIDTDVLRLLLERHREAAHPTREPILREEISRKNTLGDLIGATDAMRHVFDSIKRMARATTNVIIRGESGVGKELVARALHEQSRRRSRAFIGVNCAALPEGLMEAELFRLRARRVYRRRRDERRTHRAGAPGDFISR